MTPAGFDLAAEVVSPGNTRREVAGKVSAWLGAGTRLVWVVNPRDETVTIHEAGRAPRRLGASDTLDGAPLLPGFRLPVATSSHGDGGRMRRAVSRRSGFDLRCPSSPPSSCSSCC